MNWDTRFGAFRQLLHTGASSPHDRAQLLDLIDDAFHTDPDRYLEQWVGYVASLHLDAPVVIACASVPAFLFLSERAPFARFDVAFDNELRGQAALKALAKSPYLGLIRSLSTSHCRLGPKGAQALADLDGLSNLESLDLGGCGIKDEGLDALIDAGLISTLDALDLAECKLTGASAQRLASLSPSFSRLDLSSNPFGVDGFLTVTAATSDLRALHVVGAPSDRATIFDLDSLSRFVALENLASVERLSMTWGSSYADADAALDYAQAFAASPYLSNLKTLGVNGTAMRQDLRAARVFFESDALPSLSSLPFTSFRSLSSEETCRAVLATPRAQEITHLDVDRRSYHFIPALVATESMASLTSLELAGHCDEDFDALAGWPGLATLRSLDLRRIGGYRDNFTTGDLDALIASPYIQGVRELVLPSDQNYYDFFEPFSTSPALDGLESLTLRASYIDWPREIQMVFDSPHVRSLQRLDLTGCSLSTSGWDTICTCNDLVAMRHLLIGNARLLPRHLKSVRSLPWFAQLETLDLTIPYPTGSIVWSSQVALASPAREDLPDDLRPLVDHSESFVIILAHSRLPKGLLDLRLNVLDHLGEPLAPASLARLVGHPDLPHDARHKLASALTLPQLKALAGELGLEGARRLKRYPLIEAMRRVG
jgi:hypothetical protein